MAGSPIEAANAAIAKLRTVREQAKQRREQVAEAVRRVRERNHEESMNTMLRVRAARRHGPPSAWPAPRPDQQMHLFDGDDFDTDNVEPPKWQPPTRQTPAPPRHQAQAQRHQAPIDEDDWSNETWLR
jgi:hypothetical protein